MVVTATSLGGVRNFMPSLAVTQKSGGDVKNTKIFNLDNPDVHKALVW